jgi:hypothetical protein
MTRNLHNRLNRLETEARDAHAADNTRTCGHAGIRLVWVYPADHSLPLPEHTGALVYRDGEAPPPLECEQCERWQARRAQGARHTGQVNVVQVTFTSCPEREAQA